jgi:hypothetical protein
MFKGAGGGLCCPFLVVSGAQPQQARPIQIRFEGAEMLLKACHVEAII